MTRTSQDVIPFPRLIPEFLEAATWPVYAESPYEISFWGVDVLVRGHFDWLLNVSDGRVEMRLSDRVNAQIIGHPEWEPDVNAISDEVIRLAGICTGVRTDVASGAAFADLPPASVNTFIDDSGKKPINMHWRQAERVTGKTEMWTRTDEAQLRRDGVVVGAWRLKKLGDTGGLQALYQGGLDGFAPTPALNAQVLSAFLIAATDYTKEKLMTPDM